MICASGKNGNDNNEKQQGVFGVRRAKMCERMSMLTGV